MKRHITFIESVLFIAVMMVIFYIAKQMIVSSVVWQVIVGVLLVICTFALFVAISISNMDKMHDELGVCHTRGKALPLHRN